MDSRGGPRHPRRERRRAVTVAVVVFTLASAASALRSHLVPPATTDMTIQLPQERA